MLHDTYLDHITSFNDLGLVLLVSSELSWHGHIYKRVSECNRANGMIKRVVLYCASNNVALIKL